MSACADSLLYSFINSVILVMAAIFFDGLHLTIFVTLSSVWVFSYVIKLWI